MPRPRKTAVKIANTKVSAPGYLERLEKEIESNQSKVSLILGALIVLVVGILVFNYFNRNQSSLGPAQQTAEATQQQDVTPDALPGKYTIKAGDTLFTIAASYFKDGYKFSEIVKANKLTNPDQIEVGQVLEIPKLEVKQAPEVSPQPSPSTTPSVSPSDQPQDLGTGGGNSTIWGSRIEGNTYTVAEGDWLSTIAGRAYGDIFAYKKLAAANNITNPDHIEPGMVLTIPR